MAGAGQAKYRPYPAYKPSGVEWLGDIPEGWETSRLKGYFDERRQKVSDKDYRPLSVTMNGIVPQLENAAKTDDGDNRKLVKKGDFVINSRSDRKGSSGVSNLDGSVSLISTVLVPKDIEPEFVHHLFKSYNFQEEFYRFGKGIVADLWSTNFAAMKNITVPVVPLPQQTKIAAFLDYETAKIDGLIAKQQRLIALLEEKRQAVISHAVTKGLDPTAPLRPSGIDWLGDVPAHWEVKRVKTVSTFLTSGPRGWSEKICENGAIFVQSGDLNELMEIEFASSKRVSVENDAETARTQLNDGDVVVCITGAKTGNVAVCANIPEVAFINQHLALIRPAKNIVPLFLGFLLKSRGGQAYFEVSQYGLKQGLSLADVNEAPMVLPPFSEQVAIVEYLVAAKKRFAALNKKAQSAITLLKERRTALISAAVTGKIDLRDWRAPEAAQFATKEFDQPQEART